MKNKICIILTVLLCGCSTPNSSKELKILAVMPTASPSVQYKPAAKAGEIRNGERFFKAIHIPE